jgi:hypothetical protein
MDRTRPGSRDEGEDNLTPIARLTRDLRDAARHLSHAEARYLVDDYYMMQENRIRTAGQIRALRETKEPVALLTWFNEQSVTLENQIKFALGRYSEGHPVGKWALGITGIGPVIAAGLLAHIDIEKAPTAGHIFRFAGLDQTVKWHGNKNARQLVDSALTAEKDEWRALLWLARATSSRPTAILKGANILAEELQPDIAMDRVDTPVVAVIHGDNILAEAYRAEVLHDVYGAIYPDVKFDWEQIVKFLSRRPWNTTLKTLCWKIGESFVQQSNRESDVYGKIYAERKRRETELNVTGQYSGKARDVLKEKKIGKSTDAYKWYSGMFSEVAARRILTADSAARPGLTKKLAREAGSGLQMLPPAHIHSRGKRFAVKIFLSHLHEVWFEYHYGRPAPAPYPFAHLGHVHKIPVPDKPEVKK